MGQEFSHESVAILHELDLGQHTLFIMSDGSIDLLVNDEQTPYLAVNGMNLDVMRCTDCSSLYKNSLNRKE